MSISLNPYLNFHGTAREALEFYHSVLGGEIRIMQYDAIPGMMGDPAEAEKIMHGQIDTPDGLTIMAADYPASMSELPDAAKPGNSVCISGDDDPRIRALWDGISQGAEIREPFAQAPWGDTFGMLEDRFGVPWMFSLAPKAAD
ncbi:VOC family protein [Leucobacter japonicus]|uniref:VOC family protein n=1 Tax=Leucobacter japonicus TaxID=1461259 RepID=UPI0006A7A00C|nr:VOC family protein [Leucobacter japonicus]